MGAFEFSCWCAATLLAGGVGGFYLGRVMEKTPSFAFGFNVGEKAGFVKGRKVGWSERFAIERDPSVTGVTSEGIGDWHGEGV